MADSTQPASETAGKVSEHVFDRDSDGEVVETHISRLALVGDLVHKRKKAVRFPFVDLSSPERRTAICAREVELNRRFSPDVYLGVEDVVDDAGRVVDTAVLMKRMPAARRLSTLVEQRADVRKCLDSVARVVATCHSAAKRSNDIASVATPESLTRLWRENLDELEPFSGTTLRAEVLEAVGSMALEYIRGRSLLLAERIRKGRIVDGHGDLLPDDIFCLDDGPRILDCLEFDDRLRWGDVLYDVCFLAMDFERLGRRDLADQLLRSYGRYSAEDHPHSLEHHYIAYRALVRAKVSCLKGSSERRLAASYLELCHRHLTEGSVRIVLVGGLPGSGKTTLATALGDELGWTVLRSDEVRKERAGLDVREPAPAHFEQGLYAPEATADTYRELCDRAGTLVSFGESVVLDASFARADQRALMAEVAARTSSRSVALRCVVPREVASVRLARRAASATDASDADVAVMSQMAAHFAEWPDATLVDMVPDVRHVLPALIDQIAGHAPFPR